MMRLFSELENEENDLILTLAAARGALADVVVGFNQPEELIAQRVREIHQAVLARSPYVRVSNFTTIHCRDLELLFNAYEERFFAGLFLRALEGRRITFRLSKRMTRVGGTTTHFLNAKNGEVSYEIAIAVGLLFDGFREMDRLITVSGLKCANRLEALQRIFEHEIVHLIELLCWETSNCAATRFQGIARRLFLHRAHTHHLITWRERAAGSGIQPGSRVTFVYEGRRLVGRVRRITKRATVLVEDVAGRAYSDGRRYKVYYVPITCLEPLAVHLIDAGSPGSGEPQRSAGSA